MASAARRLTPLFDRVLVSKMVAEVKSAGGVLLPESSQKAPANEATVVSVGPGFRTEAGSYISCAVAEGDKVLLPEFGGTKVTFDKEDFFIYRDSDILGKLE